jgi:hypothetical protein
VYVITSPMRNAATGTGFAYTIEPRPIDPRIESPVTT